MKIQDYLTSEKHFNEKKDMPIIQEVISQVADTKPFKDVRLVMGHFLAYNSVSLFEALWRGGADITMCIPFQVRVTPALTKELSTFDFPILPVEEALKEGDFFVDNAGSLGKLRTPRGAVEVTRTGDWVYQDLPCPSICIDRSRIKYIEDFLGTGESFVRGWQHLRPEDPLAGKTIVLFGYGKVGKGVAFFGEKSGAEIIVVDRDPQVVAKASGEGFEAIDLKDETLLKKALAKAKIIIGATGIPGAIGESVPSPWLLANFPSFVNIGHDEFGEAVPDEQIIGGRHVPINFHLDRPTRNHKIDPIQSAEVLALEYLVQNYYQVKPGVNPLPTGIDKWIFDRWMHYWPEEDLSGIAEEINLNH